MKKQLRKILGLFIVFTLLLSFNDYVHSDEHFYHYAITGDSTLLYKDVPVKISFSSEPTEKFLLKPFITGAKIKFYNFESQSWEDAHTDWNLNSKNYPFVLLKTSNESFKKASLSFELLNIKTEKIHKTNKLTFWSANEYKEYMEKVNTNIFEWNTLQL